MANSDLRSATMSVLVENESGVLARVIGLFSGRGYNIDSLTVAPVERDGSKSGRPRLSRPPPRAARNAVYSANRGAGAPPA